jgi:Na+-transporting methylmalonyl-CoA/oxaloacetate decarboxylase gamma subunit
MPAPQHDWLALPCTVISILLTTIVMRAFTSTKEKGLSTVIKATFAFIVILALTMYAAKMVVKHDYEEESGEEELEERKEGKVTKKLTKKDRKEKEKRVKSELIKRFWPTRKEMLGRRKEVVVEVVEEQEVD